MRQNALLIILFIVLTITALCAQQVGINNDDSKPDDSAMLDVYSTSMRNAYPNPFIRDTSTHIEVSVKAGETGTLTIYNVAGQAVKRFDLTQGNITLQWNGRDDKGLLCASGIYFYKLSTPTFNQTRKMVLIK